jgi:hypothetical protein
MNLAALALPVVAAMLAYPPQPPVVANRPGGVMVWYRQDWLDLQRYPVTAPTFTPADNAWVIASYAESDSHWYWSGSFVNPTVPDSDACATLIALAEGNWLRLRLWVTDPGGIGGGYVPVIDWWEFRPTDTNRDGLVNSTDISAFMDAWMLHIEDTEQPGDWNGDGAADSADFGAYLADWLAAVEGGG